MRSAQLTAFRLVSALLAGAFLILSAPSADAGVITFDEFAADNFNGGIPATRYNFLGVTFVAPDDGATRDGISNGDPGNWGLDGTNGPIFSGFNESYGLTLEFDTLISGFSLDASRSNGSSDGDSLLVHGYLGATLVDSVNLVFGDINNWSTFALTGIIDTVVWQGSGLEDFHPFGVDNIVWTGARAVPEPMTLALFGAGLAGLAVIRRRRKAKA